MPPSPTRTTLNATDLENGMGVLSSPQGSYWADSVLDNITARAGGGQTNAFQITTQNSRITTVAAIGDSIKLPPAVPGLDLIIVNHGANPMQVFGSGTDTIDDVASATGVPQMQDSTTLYYCMTAGMWYTEGLASGYARGSVGSFQTLSVQTGIAAHAGGGQGAATPLTAMNCFVATVATAADSLLLPPAKPGMEITVINQTTNTAATFPATGETINGQAANASVAQPTGSAQGGVSIFFCGIAGQWWTK